MLQKEEAGILDVERIKSVRQRVHTALVHELRLLRALFPESRAHDIAS